MAVVGRLIHEERAAEARRARLAGVAAPCGHSVNEYRSAYDCDTRENADKVRCRICGALISETALMELADA